MLTRFRQWREETHSTGFELVRHFLARFFDNDLGSNAGDWQKVAVGLFAALSSVGILGLRTYIRRYSNPESPAYLSPDFYRQFIREDMLSFLGVAIAATALLTVLLWQSLFPSARDYLALAGLPVSARQIFRAKFGALLALFGAFVLTLTGPPAALFATITAGRWRENPSALAAIAANFAALAGVCVFVFFGLFALQGILLNLLPGRIFTRASLVAQGTVFIATMGALPLLGRQPEAEWWPSIWFLHLREAILTGRADGRIALAAVLLPPAIGFLAYLLSYHRYRRLMLEAPPERTVRRTGFGSRLLERWIGDPRQQAAFAFIWKGLARSRSHRLILLAYAGIALGWITKGALDTPKPSLRDEGMYGLLSVVVPLALSMLATVGLRYVFSMPVTLRANWVFQTMDQDGRAAWLAAVERFVVWCGIAPIFLASLPAAIAILGWLRALAVLALGFFASLLWFEAMFRRWRKLPFTCSYLPGKQHVVFTAVRYGAAVGMLGPVGQLILYCSGELNAFAALGTFLGFAWWRLRKARRAFWSQCPLSYEESAEADVMQLGLQGTDELTTKGAAAAPGPEAALFSDSLVVSRGLLPRAWAEEIEEDRRRPSLLFETFLEDVRYGLRLIRRSPLFSGVVVLTLTVGIGINASVFTVANGMAFRPHVWKDPGSFLRVIPKARLQDTVREASNAEYIAYRDRARSLRQLAAWAHFPAFIGDDNSAGSVGMAVSCNFFQVDGLERAIAGRLLTAEDCVGHAAVGVISEALWRGRFGSDPATVGRTMEVNSRPVLIVGVVPNRTGAWSRLRASIWVPYTAQSYFETTAHVDSVLWLQLAGRLAPGYSRSAAEAELNILARQQDALHFGRATSIATTDGSLIKELELTMTGRQLMLMAFFVGAFNLVLIISCANVATLLLARAAVRRREIAVRLSLGAPRIRLVRMLVTESLLLAAIAGAASIYLAWRVPEPLFRMLSGRASDFPMTPDWRTFAYVAGAVFATGVLAGLAPALQSVKEDLSGSLKGSRTGAALFGFGGGRRLQDLLVGAQVAMSMALLVGAALFARAEDRSLRADPGYLPQKVVVAPLFFPDSNSMQSTGVGLLAITQRVMAIPGVRSVAFSEGIPLFERLTVELSPPGRPDVNQPVDVYTASPFFFQTLGIPVLRGREFAPQLSDATSIVVSESLARAFWRRQDPIGKVLPLAIGNATVVGVVKDIDPLRFGGSENPSLYRMYRPHPIRNVMSVRFDSGASTGAAAVRAAIREVYPNLMVMARLVQSWIDQVTEELWNVVSLILVLGLVATLLATTGIYGAVSFAVNQRTKELGIRVALGARRLDIIREVFVSGGRPVVQGLLVGLWLSAATAAGLRQGVQGSPLQLDTSNPLLYCAAAFLLAAAAALAMLAPARRGAKADPLEALRCE